MDRQGITIKEFAWVIENILTSSISGGIAGISNLVKQKGLAAAIHVGVYSGWLGGAIERTLDYLDIFQNASYAIANWVDTHDFYLNNGRFNA